MTRLRIALALSALATASAFAGSITYDAAVNGLNAPAGTSFTANVGGALAIGANEVGAPYVNVAGGEKLKYLGVVSRSSDFEIELQESILVSFLQPQRFDYLILGLLFDGPEYGDLNETAGAFIGDLLFTLVAQGSQTATWSLSGATVTNLSPATDGSGGGVWRVDNPFGSLPVSSILLTPISSNPVGNQSDFGLVGFKTTLVPDASSTLGLLALGLAALSFAARRRT
jgi:hypothetical protein